MSNRNPLLMYPINVGDKCQIRLKQSTYYQECLQDTIWTWLSSKNGLQRSNNENELPDISMNVNSNSLCCYRWAFLDCLTASIKQTCQFNNHEFRSFINKRNMLIEHYENDDCHEIHYNHWFTCHMSWQAFTLILFISALLCAIFGFLLAWNWGWIGQTKARSNSTNIHHNNQSTTSRALTDL